MGLRKPVSSIPKLDGVSLVTTADISIALKLLKLRSRRSLARSVSSSQSLPGANMGTIASMRMCRTHPMDPRLERHVSSSPSLAGVSTEIAASICIYRDQIQEAALSTRKKLEKLASFLQKLVGANMQTHAILST